MNYKKILLITLFVVFLGAFYFHTANYFLGMEKESYIKNQKINQAALERIISQRVFYIIDRGEGNISEYQITKISDDSTVFSLLEELGQRENFEIEKTFYQEMGVFVESIDGVKNGTDGKYWQYWVNGELPMVAADKKKVEKGNKIEWKFETLLEF